MHRERDAAGLATVLGLAAKEATVLELRLVRRSGLAVPLTARLVADIERFNLADRVTVAGAVPAERLEALYASADIFVLASRFEGYGMAFAEAIAHGLPLVGTPAEACPPRPRALGMLPPEDIGAFSAAVRQLIEFPRSAIVLQRRHEGRPQSRSHLGAVSGSVLSDDRGGGVLAFSAEWLELRGPVRSACTQSTVLAHSPERSPTAPRLRLSISPAAQAQRWLRSLCIFRAGSAGASLITIRACLRAASSRLSGRTS